MDFYEILYSVADTLIKSGVHIVKTGIEKVSESIEQKIKEYTVRSFNIDRSDYDDWFSYAETIERIRDYIIVNMGGTNNIVSFSKYYAKYSEGFEFVFYDMGKVNCYKLKNYARVWVSDSRESIILLPKRNPYDLNQILYSPNQNRFLN